MESCLGPITSIKPEEEFQSSPTTPPSHEPEAVVVQGWFSQPDETLSNMDEELLDDELTLWEWESDSTVSDEAASLAVEEEILDGNYETTIPELEEESTDLPNELQTTALEAQQKLEAGLPNSVKKLLGLPISLAAEQIITPPAEPVKPKEDLPTTKTTGLRDTIQALYKKEKLGGHQRKRLRLMNKELTQRESLGIDLDLPFSKGNNGETQQPNAKLSALIANLEKKPRDPLWWEDKRVQQQILQNPELYLPPPGFSPSF